MNHTHAPAQALDAMIRWAPFVGNTLSSELQIMVIGLKRTLAKCRAPRDNSHTHEKLPSIAALTQTE